MKAHFAQPPSSSPLSSEPPAGNPEVRSVLLVDEHAVVRQGLRGLIGAQQDLVVCAEAETDQGARAAVRQLHPDAMITDLGLQRGEGIELVRDVRAHHKHLAILVLSMHDENVYAERMLMAGANGYIMKQAPTGEVLVALRRVLAGDVYVSQVIAAAMIEKLAAGRNRRTNIDPIEGLSTREIQVLHMIGKGMSTRAIALSLNLSGKTIETHRQRLKRRLNLKTSARLVQYAMQWFIGEPHDIAFRDHDIRDAHELNAGLGRSDGDISSYTAVMQQRPSGSAPNALAVHD